MTDPFSESADLDFSALGWSAGWAGADRYTTIRDLLRSLFTEGHVTPVCDCLLWLDGYDRGAHERAEAVAAMAGRPEEPMAELPF